MDLFFQWFRNNLDIVFFIYGFAFVVMGLAILVQPKKGSEFHLANILWLLAFFGLLHGTNEFLDMWAIIKGRHPVLDVVRWFILAASYIFLFEFGRQLFKIHPQISHQWHRKIAKLLVWWLSPLIGVFILVSGFMSSDFWKASTIWTRYLLGFPGGLLIGSGFLLCSYHDISIKLKLRKYFWTGGVSFLLYGVVGGLVVPKGDFFPASHLNTELFITTVKIPVQVFRTIFAVTALWAVGGMLKIFNWEARQKLWEIQERLELQIIVNEKYIKNLDEAQRIAHLGNWDWDIVNNELRWSDEIYRIFGLQPREFGATYEAFLSSVHPDDREFVKKSVNEALYEKKPYSIDHRIVLPDGTGRIVHEQAEVTFDKADKPVRMIGTVQDITEPAYAVDTTIYYM